jgi:DNA-binding transcriptional regulator GbsR (MarR family)
MTSPDQTVTNLFADLAQHFGLSRPAGQCFAGIWRAARPPCADDLVAGLGLSRSNVSTALKELRGWGLIGIARSPGDRKEYFTAPADPWELARLILAARQRQLVAPLLDRLLAAEESSGDVRLAVLHEALALVSGVTEALIALAPADLAQRLSGLGETAGKGKKKKKKR